ncbi:porin [Vibrio splendidus]|uniref:porin n=1 Tax=Vibrio splendidus TaxID=29497 RepID=UPI00148C664A|nr:porin [Vibrio splendidus]NOJ08900.1 porin [Vibrio splendidus]
MKKTLLALAIAAVSTSAFAVETSSQNSKPVFEFDDMHKDQFSVSGAWGVGGYYDTGTKAFYDDWATGLTLAISYKNNRWVGYFETDLELNYSSDEQKVDIQSGPSTDVDKAWLGFTTDAGVISLGWENDTALDKVDGAGDFTYEFGASAGDASDGFNVAKFQGATSGIAYGISVFDTDDNRDKGEMGYNGYIGVEQEMFNIYAGYEAREDSDYTVTSVSGNVTLDALKLGLNAWIDDGEVGKDKSDVKLTGFYASAGYALSEKLTLAAGYATNTTENSSKAINGEDIDQSYMNVAAMYTLSDKVDMGIDIKQELDSGFSNVDEETHVFAAAYYYF